MKKTKEQKAITLIALIITIVVLLILAAVAISSITNDGILSYATNAAKDYNQAVADEQEKLNEYVNFLNNGGSGSGSSEEDDRNERYTAYSIGDIVTTGTEEFYVIEASSETEEMVILLAKESINTTSLAQSSSANTVAFSTESYWGSGTSPYDIVEPEAIPESHVAAKAASDYGIKLGGTGRLMTHNEANILVGSYSAIIYGTDTTNGYLYYWLGSAVDSYSVWYVSGNYKTFSSFDYDFVGYWVRPVVEISKSKVTPVTE